MIVHDFAGMSHRDRLPVDLQHEWCEPIGYIDKLEVTDGGLECDGYLIAIIGDDDDKGMEVILRGQAGIPYQASIDLEPNSVVLEYVPEGFQADANGRRTTDRKRLCASGICLGAAICIKPWDTGTEAQFSKDGQSKDVPITLNWKDKGKFAMTATTKPNQLTNQLSRSTMYAASSPKLKRMSWGMFGRRRRQRVPAAGKPYEAALEEHIGKLSKQVTDERRAPMKPKPN